VCNWKKPSAIFFNSNPHFVCIKNMENICKPMNVTSFGESHYFVLFKDDFFGYIFVFNVKNKSIILKKFKQFEFYFEKG
jgi:hypothetical protein